jgi:predicted Zn-dependent protease
MLPALILLMCSFLLPGCKPSGLVSRNQEIDIGRQASQDIEREYKLVEDPQMNAMVDQMGQALAKCSDRQDITYTFKILDIKDVNAVSLPGGWVYVYKGLMDRTKDDPNQLAGVLAHEIGHIAARHHADMIGRQTYASILIGTLTKGDVTQIAGIFANITLLRWSRKHEYEADKLGIKYMYRCKQYDPQGLINFFNLLLQEQKKKPSELEQIFLTHPVTEERIKRAQTYYDDLRSGQISAD